MTINILFQAIAIGYIVGKLGVLNVSRDGKSSHDMMLFYFPPQVVLKLEFLIQHNSSTKPNKKYPLTR